MNTPIFTLAGERELYLASASPRRKDLLESLALPFSVIRPENAERKALPHEDPQTFVSQAALLKGHCALKQFPSLKNGEFLLIAADTIVCLDGKILGKPENSAHAFQMLKKLSGRTHQVLSSVYLAWNAGSSLLEDNFTEVTKVTFYPWSDEVLKNYSRSEEPLDKAGAYAIQGLGAFLAKSIEGSWTNVVGLPLSTLIQNLLKLNLLVPAV